MATELALHAGQRMPAPPPAQVSLGTVLVAPYQSIRVLAACGFDAAGPVIVTLMHLEGEFALAPLDEFTLTPLSEHNQVYAVPGVILGVSARAAGDADTNVDVYIWGYRIDAEGGVLDPNVAPKADGTLVVHVVEEGGAAAGANIEVIFDDVTLGTTGADGSATITRIESEYALMARHPDGRTSEPVSVSIVGDETNEVTVTLPPP
jgi:hypothetical protein